MATSIELPLPRLPPGSYAHIDALTDDALFNATGIRIAFTGRSGGVSSGSFSSLNLGSAVNDDMAAVSENRRILCAELGYAGNSPIVPRQVHGDVLVCIEGNDDASVSSARCLAEEGADGIVVDADDVAALLCFADCVPLIIVSPLRSFAVVHAGWRGVENGIAVKAAKELAARDQAATGENTISSLNVYIGPHICAECFETSPDVHGRFTDAFGLACAYDERHIDLSAALHIGLGRAGVDPDRIFDSGLCTACENDRYFSFRAQDGVCGRQGAFAVRQGDRT